MIKVLVMGGSYFIGKEAKIIEYDYKNYNRKELDFFPFFNYDNVLDVSKINKFYNIETDFKIGLKTAFDWYCTNIDSVFLKENVIKNEQNILRELNYL